MKRTCLKSFFLIAVALSILVTPTLYAASLTLTHIGGLATNGATYSEWWYTGTNPLLRGTADADAEVSIALGSETHSVTADANGNWSYQTSLSAQDYNVVIGSGGEQYSFTLHAGQSQSSGTSTTTETTQSTAAVPPTGYNQIAGIIGGTTLAAAGIYAYLHGKKSTKKAYAKEVLRSLR